MNSIVVGGISLDPIFAVKAQPVQQSEEAIAYQNHFVISVRFTAGKSGIWICRGDWGAASGSASISISMSAGYFSGNGDV